MMIFYFEHYDLSRSQMRIYVRTRPSTWILYDIKTNLSPNTTFRGVNQIMNYEGELFLLHGYKTNELKKINLFGLNITDSLEKRNAELNESFLKNPIFCELKENNFFGISRCGAISFGPVRRENKLAPNTEYIFCKDNLFDVPLKYKDLSFEFEEMFKNFYISFIGFLTADENGTYYKGIENKNHPILAIDICHNDLYPILKEYLNNLYENK